tara:strand:- start:1765 stop:2016 length:252 start_codon:yes stop_codon:yes gene_type:complete
MDIASLIGWMLVLILFIVIIMGLLWMRGRSLRLEKMLDEGDVEILNLGNVQSEILNHFPEGSQIIPYTPYIIDPEDVDSRSMN